MVQGCARLRKSKLGVEQTWDARESTNLEAKVLGEQDKSTDEPEIDLARG